MEELYAEFEFRAAWLCLHRPGACGGFWEAESVVVKVQHAGIEQVVHTDLQIMQQVAALVMRYATSIPYDVSAIRGGVPPPTAAPSGFTSGGAQPGALHREFRQGTSGEVPCATQSLSSQYVLTMERLDGFKVTDSERIDRLGGRDRKALARQGAEVFLEMIFRGRVFSRGPASGQPSGADGSSHRSAGLRDGRPHRRAYA